MRSVKQRGALALTPQPAFRAIARTAIIELRHETHSRPAGDRRFLRLRETRHA
jgi:hypothetical protein